jgi:hypothetical protein
VGVEDKISVIRLLKQTANVLMLSGLLGAVSEAAVMEIEAKFSPDPSNPLVNKFINTTKFTGFCQGNEPACERRGLSSFRTPITFTATRPIRVHETNRREAAMFSIPAEWRTLTVTKMGGASTETAEVKVRMPGFAVNYRLSHDARDLVGRPDLGSNAAHGLLWQGGLWLSPPSPCQWAIKASTNTREHETFWLTPAGSACHKAPNYIIPEFDYKSFDFAYELQTPEPLKLSQGTYTGSIQYSVGPGKDFDMGDVMLPSEDSLTLNFTLTVEHMLKVEVPPGGHRVELVPQGGWQSWLQQGRKPTRLFKDQTFNISASSRFKMELECQYTQDGNTCSLQEPISGHVVPLNISVSLPHGLTDASGQPVTRRQLLLNGSGTKLFQPGFYVERRPGTLHFEIPSSEVAEMIRPGRSRYYSGNVTVIWDSEV